MAALNTAAIRAMKGKEKISMLTAYDYTSAVLFDRAGVDMLLVGDSLGMVMHGRPDTVSVTLDEMILHTRAVVAGTERAMVVSDLPFMTYERSVDNALKNAARLVQKSGVRAVKLEGPHYEQVKALTAAGIPVVGHIGLTPQRAAEFGGFKVQGRTTEAALDLLEQARRLQDAGCFSIVIECVPSALGEMITEALEIPTIGIGAGPGCDGQVLVMHDMLGLFDRFVPKFVKRFAELGQEFQNVAAEYSREVKNGVFPGPEHCFSMAPEELEKLKK
ncbi:MAG: 3-methyl-2-oxobutanoate hydroxymethyltransferase [Desulfovibrionaceae bacterium]|nr:3-methyl-2-oxobutanoate hydroxymethyltransferase [Desulfovibrionaceae bacterium]